MYFSIANQPAIGIPNLWKPPALRILRMRRTVPPKEASLWGEGNPSIFLWFDRFGLMTGNLFTTNCLVQAAYENFNRVERAH